MASTSSKGCVAYNSTTSITFSSRREAANWLIMEGLTTFQPNTITKKIAAAIRDNTAAFGYAWKAIAAPTLTENHNIQELVKEDEQETYGVERTPKQPFTPIDWEPLLAAANASIEQERAAAYDESMGIKNILFKILPHRKTKEDLMRECGISIPRYNMYAAVGLNIYGINDLGELAILTKTNLTAANIQEILECGTLNNNIQISIDDNYIDSVRSYLNEWDKQL